MNKNAIKKFAIEARQKLIASVTDKAGMLGITAEGVSAPTTKGNDFEVYQTAAGTEVTLNKKQCEQRRRLVEQIETKGFEEVVEEVAYTWFNRICAIRFMEVNDYLPSRVRALSSEKEGKNEPDLVTQAPDVDLDLTDAEKEFVIESKMSGKLDELFALLFVKQCNKLHEVLPELFEETSDYTEMLLNISFTNKDDVVRMIVDEIPEKDFNITTADENGNVPGQVEIIGWLYQYYNTELKDDTFAKLKKNIKITKERIPAATQVFTPDWIVRYMVENSVGRIWIEHLRTVNPSVDEKKTAEELGWKYYLPEAEQEETVNQQLLAIRAEYKDLTPEDITCIDPCMGSGHILVAMFDVLMDIYKSAGYSERDAALFIVQKNIYGLDIDKRAYQLAYFAVMMKGRQYNRKFLRVTEEQPKPMLFAIQDSNSIRREQLKYFGAGLSDCEKENAANQIKVLLDQFIDAKEYGSILNITECNEKLLRSFVGNYDVDQQMSIDTIGIDETKDILLKLIDLSYVMIKKYDVVCTNPPYMGLRNMSQKLSDYCKNNYPLTSTDLFSCFIEKGFNYSKHNGYNCMVTMQSWMFLSSFEKFRCELLATKTITTLQHMDNMVMGIAFGTAAFAIRNCRISNFKGIYDYITLKDLEFDRPVEFPIKNRYSEINSEMFGSIDGSPIAYWSSKITFNNFSNNKKLSDIAKPRQGVKTLNNDYFMKFWFEVSKEKIGFDMSSFEEAKASRKKWFPYTKGGDFRKWYGNNDYVVNWENDGAEMKAYAISQYNSVTRTITNLQYWFQKGLTWSMISSGSFSVRYVEGGFGFDARGSMMFMPEKHLLYVLGFLCSNVVNAYMDIVSPTISFEVGNISKLPVIFNDNYTKQVNDLVEECIQISKKDWDSYEYSWDFKKHPLVIYKESYLSMAYERWENEVNNSFLRLKENEETLNKIFDKIYGLENELEWRELDKLVTVRRAELKRDIKSLISYAVGCMMGRYSVNTDGIVYAGGEWSDEKYRDFRPDEDNIIPITDDEYFSDDIVGRFCEWLKVIYGEETLEDNLDFIAKALGSKGDSSREIIRNYFLKDFINDHIKIYQKRPIYWLFDSGKEDGFKALIYMHRYTPDTVGIIRTEYLHKTQKALEQAMQRAQYTSENASNVADKKKAVQQITKYTKQLAQMKTYDEAMAHIANQRIEIDLDDGVKVNYEKFQGVEVAQEGKKALKIDLLAKIK